MKTALILFVSLALISTASAASINISVVSHNIDVQSTFTQLKACSCGSATDSFTVKNLGDLESGFGFSVQGDQPWFSIDKSTAYLTPGQSTDFSVYTSPPCGATTTAHYTVYVSSEYGRYRAIDKSIETGVCENIKANITPQQATIEPCAVQTFKLNLTNVATYREHYTVDGLGMQSTTLDPGESTTLYGGYKASCSQWGAQQIPVTVKADTSGLSDTEYVTVTVPRSYDYSLSLADVDKPVCKGVSSEIPAIITNTEDRDNTFSLSGEPGVSSATVYVPSNSTRVTMLSFTPANAGNSVATVTATGANGTIQKKASVNLSVEACYGFSVESAKSVQSCSGKLYVPFTIKSAGDQVQKLHFDVLSNATTSLDTLSATLNPGQEFAKTVEVSVPDADNKFYVTLVANSTYSNMQATTLVNAYSTESCYEAAPESTNFRVWTDQTILPVIVKQTGIQPATYSVQYNGTFMRPMEKNISLSPQGEAVLHFTINSTGYKTGVYLNRLTLSTNGVHYTTDFKVNLAQKGFWQQFLDACKWNGSFGVCSVTSTLSFIVMLLVVIAVLGIIVGFVRYENPSWYSKETAAIIGGAILIALLVIMIIAAPAIPRSYERPVLPANESALYYEVGAGQTISLNVSKFFYSPDNNTMTFTSSQPMHLQIRMQDGMALIKPNEGYVGEDTAVFTANDGHGGITDSELFRINVIPLRPVTFLEYWVYGCWFLTALFLFIAVALALLTTIFIKRVKPIVEYKRALVLYRKPRSHLMPGNAQELVERTDTRIQQLAPGTPVTQVGQVIGTQIINPKGEQVYVASAEGTKFHRITCPVVKGMPKDNRLTFSTREEAIKAGYTPCKTCSSHE